MEISELSDKTNFKFFNENREDRTPNEERYLIALHSIKGMSSFRLFNLFAHFGSAEEIWKNPNRWGEALKYRTKDLETLVKNKNEISSFAAYSYYEQCDVKYVCALDNDYPEYFRNINDPPFLIFYKGELPKKNSHGIAVIGTRECTDYGGKVAFNLGKDLSRYGFYIVGGMARGIDTEGHLGALRGEGKTVAVLGSGLDVIYPPENTKLYKDIIENGCVISEFPLGTEPERNNFPYRNRLISALSDGIIIVEAGVKSGTSTTVTHAIEQGKEVFAVPGPVFSSRSMGTHKLIRSGCATLVTSANDVLDSLNVLEKYGYTLIEEEKPKYQTEEEKLIENIMSTPCHINDIAKALDKPVSETLSLLALWELNGLVDQLPGQNFVAKQKL